ncbi:hypothetical protein Daus18300_003497 [Diaporthe australafricana]|uniref:CrcB-like protein n=1 Tax=Diaporthe australafricana TaxID=127596 RepID=A0ABR3XEV8_9PEZI
MSRIPSQTPVKGIGRGLSEVEAPGPVQDEDEAPIAHHRSLEDQVSSQRTSRALFNFFADGENTSGELSAGEYHVGGDDDDREEYSDPSGVGNLAETAPEAIVENPNEARRFSHHTLEEEIGQGSKHQSSHGKARSGGVGHIGRFKTDVFILAHLVVFSILGTLAREGLSMLTAYPAQPAHFTSLWPNFAGSLVLGFLSEGAELFHHPKAARSLSRAPTITRKDTRERSPSDTERSDLGGREKEGRHASESPLPVPLQIGLATGFCGSFTTYSAFMRDSFEALGGMLGPTSKPSPGQDFMSVGAVIIVTLSMSIGGLRAGAHAAIFLKRYEKRLPTHVLRAMDRASMVLGAALWGCAIAMAVVLAVWPPGQEMWWRQALLSLAFAPLGTLLRFVVSMWLNNRVIGFPLGTFCVNMLGTLVLAVAWDLQRLPDRGIVANIGGDMISCQVLQAIEDGFCGCLTTVSTWVLELSTLKRKHAYQYGFASIVTSLAIVVVVMGPLKWTVKLSQPSCVAL